jgi:alpha-amylase
MPDNFTLFQFFHWYYSPEGNLWQHAAEKASHLSKLGITHIWLPPAYKSAGGVNEPGYAVYDLYDLGEFDQKGSVRTRYGTRDEYLNCIKSIHDNGMQVIGDIVLNHKHGADETEMTTVQPVNPQNRNEPIGEPKVIEAHTKFYFPARNKKYSEFIWDWQCFTGIDDPGNGAIYLILNPYCCNSWDEMLEDENGNFDYLMGADIEFRNPHVKEELKRWGVWYIETTGIDAFRLDAVKHITPVFFAEWLAHVNDHFNRKFFTVGEYWRNDVHPLLKYIEATKGEIQLFDVPLHSNFHNASIKCAEYDMRTILDNTLVHTAPTHAITFVDNHDTQPLQSLQSPVEYWFKPLAYALILLREQGIPCVFYPALFEAKYIDHRDGQEVYVELNAVPFLDIMLRIRKHLAYGPQKDYFDHPNTIGWTREGNDEKPHSGFAVVLTNSAAGDKMMQIGQRHSGRRFVNACNREEKILIDESGSANFRAPDRSIAIWMDEQALSILD